MRVLTKILLWVAAFILTLAIARYQRMSGPTHPIDGIVELAGAYYDYSVKRTHGGKSDHPVELIISDTLVTGSVVWKRYKLDEEPHRIPLERQGDTLRAFLPHQPPAGKLEYQVVLQRGEVIRELPPEKTAVIRFKGSVPLPVLIIHVILMFGALLVAARTGFSALFNEKTAILAWITLALMIVGGLIFGPIVQKYAFGAFWTGWPLGEDLTDNKTAVMALIWIIIVWRLRKWDQQAKGKWWIIGAVVCTFLVYLIPHSMRGSELDYSVLPPDSLKTLTLPGQHQSIPGGFDQANP